MGKKKNRGNKNLAPKDGAQEAPEPLNPTKTNSLQLKDLLMNAEGGLEADPKTMVDQLQKNFLGGGLMGNDKETELDTDSLFAEIDELMVGIDDRINGIISRFLICDTHAQIFRISEVIRQHTRLEF